MLARILAALHTTSSAPSAGRVTRFAYVFCTSSLLGLRLYNVFPG